jgi:hypothetical protein
MSAFLTELFNSIFTPGPTPTLIVATNTSFACLQLVLLLLLVATYSIHFVVLSFLSAGLWWAINWFVAELNEVRTAEAAKEREKQLEESDSDGETVIGSGPQGSGSKAVEVLDTSGELKARTGVTSSPSASKSEISTEDEWERVSGEENEKDK